MKKRTKKKILITSLITLAGRAILYSLLKKKSSPEIYSLAEIQKHLDKMIQAGGGKDEEMAYDCIDEIYNATEKILSKYPSDNHYLGYIKRTLGI